MSVLNTIEDALSALMEEYPELQMEKAYYGQCSETKLKFWNYFVYGRKQSVEASNKRDLQHEFVVNIIHEDYIPEGLVEKVIEALQNQDNETIRRTTDPITYTYLLKGNTNMVVEIATITFYRPHKRERNVSKI